jgi:DNA/RNA-binding domain of Phe-tRNA-synthetase-like protein
MTRSMRLPSKRARTDPTEAPVVPLMPRFRYDATVTARFPTIVGGIIHARGVASGSTSTDLARAIRDEQAAVLDQIGETPLSELPTLAAWRRVFRGFGVDPTAYRSAAEALLRRLTKQGSIPSIGALVDLGNLVSIRYGLPVSVMDQAVVTGGTTVRFAVGHERFTDLGSRARETPEPGEVIFVDEAGQVSARRWCWRQSAESASGPATTEILVTVEGHHAAASSDVAAAMGDLEGLLRIHAAPAEMVAAVLHAGAPVFHGLDAG